MADKIVCAWCGHLAHVAPNQGNQFITHGICLFCAVAELKSIGINPTSYIEHYIKKIARENEYVE